MAKKKTAKKSTSNAKAAPTADDQNKALVAKAMARAARQIEASLSVKAVAIDPGSYPVAVNIDIDGELLVEKPVEAGPERTVPDFGMEELLVAMLTGRSASHISECVQRGLAQIRALRSGSGADKAVAEGEMERTRAMLVEMIDAGAKRRRLTRSVRTPARSGAVKGKPGVAVNGSVGEREVRVEVEGGKG